MQQLEDSVRRWVDAANWAAHQWVWRRTGSERLTMAVYWVFTVANAPLWRRWSARHPY